MYIGCDVRTSERPSGNSRLAFLWRLRKDRPDIHARVLAGELSLYAGMVEAGFRKRRPCPPLRGQQRAIKHDNGEKMKEYIDVAKRYNDAITALKKYGKGLN